MACFVFRVAKFRVFEFRVFKIRPISRSTAYFISMPSAYAADVFITPCLPPCSSQRVLARQK